MTDWRESQSSKQSAQSKDKRLSFSDWLPVVSPAFVWNWKHLRYIQAQLARVTSGEIDRLILTIPPRHGKSEQTTIRYPVWFLEQDPTKRVIVGCYNQTLANKFSRKARGIARERLALSDERTAADDWETKEGGGFRAVGVGAGVTGMGGDLIIVDDPVKNRQEANSQAYRDRVWDWYTDDLYTRLEPGGKIIVIMTRWQEDDLVGRLLASEDADAWTVVNLPALAENDDPLGRKPGEALCPERYDESALERIKRVMGRSFTALYQCRPSAPEGDFFQRGWFEFVGAAPANCTWVRYWDKAGTTDDGDFTVGVLMGRSPDGFFYVDDVVRGQWSAHQREKTMKATAELDRSRGRDVLHVHEQEGGSGGKDSAGTTTRNLAGFRVVAQRSTGDKTTRAEPFADQAEAGNVKIVRAPWNTGYINELTTFPNGANDDQVDASSGAFNRLAVGYTDMAESPW